ncbi:hypothetical protein L915_07914 [Phytophthora nicotianae]|uniref:Uncharacterized protein n=3 Tax=Phytophthora nicotianae TaxID=4792 RepID=W2GXH8_PHYNI|nr:hypothetical protein L915_07914 [Phytophthora nicotianae]ETL40045.1 hypothetical protein L916_08691 [Phytophthora nicotianae]
MQTKLVPADRTTVIFWPDISILLSDLLRWAKVTPNIRLVKATLNANPKAMSDRILIGREPLCRRESVDQADFDYNFVVPLELVRTMERVLIEEKRHDRRIKSLLQPLDVSKSTAEIVVSYGKQLKEFRSRAVFRQTNFYAISQLCSS